MKKLDHVVSNVILNLKNKDKDKDKNKKGVIDSHLDRLMNEIESHASDFPITSHSNGTPKSGIETLVEQFKEIEENNPQKDYGYTPRDQATLSAVIKGGNMRERLNLFYDYTRSVVCPTFSSQFKNKAEIDQLGSKGCPRGPLQKDIEEGAPRKDTRLCNCPGKYCDQSCRDHWNNQSQEFNARIEQALKSDHSLNDLDKINPPLSEREKSALTAKLGNNQNLVSRSNGSMSRIPASCKDQPQNCHDFNRIAEENGFPLVAGLSGTTSMLLASQQAFGLNTKQDKELTRLALLGWMINSGDHSAYEIMQASRAYGLEFDPSSDYYKNLIPSNEELNKRIKKLVEKEMGDELPSKILKSCLASAEKICPLPVVNENLQLSNFSRDVRNIVLSTAREQSKSVQPLQAPNRYNVVLPPIK
jgi:hypothetical protein